MEGWWWEPGRGRRKADRSPRCWRPTWTRWTSRVLLRTLRGRCNVYVGGATAARVVRNLPKWIAKHLRFERAQAGVGRWDADPGFRITRGADRSGPGEPEAAEVTGAPTLGRPTEPQQPGTERPMAAAHPRLVGILPAGGRRQMLLVALAWLASEPLLRVAHSSKVGTPSPLPPCRRQESRRSYR